MQLGASGLVVSRLCFGTLSFGLVDAASGQASMAGLQKVDKATASRLVSQALDAGITYFNTADVYAEGRSEQLLGNALGQRRKDVVICTKVGLPIGPMPTDRGLSRGHLIAAVEGSLRRLGTDWIDVLVLHCVDRHTPLEETLAAVEHLTASGKVRYCGVSNWPAWLVARAVQIQRARGWEPFRTAEVYYNLLGRDVEEEIVPMSLDVGLGLQAWSPLAGGALSGRIDVTRLRSGEAPLSNYDFLPLDRERVSGVLDFLEQLANDMGVSVAQLALAWLLTRPAVSSVIIGASNERQLSDNLGAIQVELDAECLARLDALTALPPRYPGWYIRTFNT